MPPTSLPGHIALHGCQQGQAILGDKYYYAHAGYNEWADTNHIIVLYPQVVVSFSRLLTRSGAGTSGVTITPTTTPRRAATRWRRSKMVDRLTSGHPALPAPTGLAASLVSDSALTLSWDSVAASTGYNIYRGSGGAPADGAAERQPADRRPTGTPGLSRAPPTPIWSAPWTAAAEGAASPR